MGEKKINVLVFYPVKGTLGKKNFQRIRLCSCDPNTVSGFVKGFCDVYSMFPGVHYSVAMLITLGNKGIFFPSISTTLKVLGFSLSRRMFDEHSSLLVQCPLVPVLRGGCVFLSK